MSKNIYSPISSDNSSNVSDETLSAKNSSFQLLNSVMKAKESPLVYCTLMLNGKPFLDKSSFSLELNQVTNDHDCFNIIVPDDALDSFDGYVMENSKNILGKSITIYFHRFGNVRQSFNGIITNIKNRKENGYGTLIITGSAPTMLLENGKACHSFENRKLDEIIKEITEEHSDIKIVIENLNTKYTLPYTVQYKESDYQFIRRLALRYGEYFYYNGQELIFGNKVQPTVILEENIDLIEVEFELNIKPQKFEYTVYDSRKGDNMKAKSSSIRSQYKENYFQAIAINASKEVYKKEQQMLFNYSGIGNVTEKELKEAVTKEKETRENLVWVKGKSKDPAVKIGGRVQLIDINGKAMETYRITEITHYHDGNIYYNEFCGSPDLYIAPYQDGEAVPVGEQQSARVVDNNDPLGMGRVRVQFPWQESKGTTSPWLRLLQPHGGDGKGFYFVPEKGEEISVGFESNNAEKPYVMGSHYNGAEKSGYQTENNTKKVIQTRSGNRIEMDDEAGSITIRDASNNTIVMDGKGNIEINAPKTIHLTAGAEIKMVAGAKISVATVNMEQAIANKLETTAVQISSKAIAKIEQSALEIMTSGEKKLDLKTKELTLKAEEKLMMHSDKEAIVNGKSTVGIKGGKINMDNKPKGPEKTKQEKDLDKVKEIGLDKIIPASVDKGVEYVDKYKKLTTDSTVKK
ncbi:Rhs element Vgr protein [Chryseobacterium bernardetii]|uniref:Rhs element Vgr protein n=1 Tax=Chryseobacterium bernardetii TaxID=1241978 RepID=A0ACC6IUJ6_9FLAO|nr:MULTISPECIES: type VI secretion system tip protein VgrG [Chryseobacterium]MDR6370876.1 Rhs element Vgr protein [Chryseobacterium vietnamense]MDR6441378.1 Rhs element Vgr protein [Chryseobacterium bernardetii]